MKKRTVLMVFLVSIWLLSGCNLPSNSTQPKYPTEVIVTLEAVLPSPTNDPITLATQTPNVVVVVEDSATETPFPLATTTPYVPFMLNSFVDNLNVRTNPGYLFPVRMMVQKTTALSVLGRSPGNEWIYVQTPDQIYGWVYARLFENEPRLLEAPLVEPGDVQIVRGQLHDVNGNPINGVQFALVQGTGNQAPRNDAMTDENGNFLAFMPIDSSGTWNVSYVAIACTSVVMDENCNTRGDRIGTVNPPSQNIDLPSEEVLTFIWK